MTISSKLQDFVASYTAEVEQPLSKDLSSYKLLVKELPVLVRDSLRVKNDNYIYKGSTGQGVHTYYPWLGIFDPRVSTGATKGFYVVILFSDDFQDIYLTLNQAATQQSRKQTEEIRQFVYTVKSTVNGFKAGRIPNGDIVKTRTGTASSNGKRYESSNIFYRKYKISTFDESDFLKHLEKLLEVYDECVINYIGFKPETPIDPPNEFAIRDFYKTTQDTNLFFKPQLIDRFVSSLITKPFVILTGLSGSGKTKLAQSFAMWICEDENQYCLVPVGADWTNREPLLGFPNALEPNKYVKPDNRALDLILNALKDENKNKPYFLILDEMNLSHVERYFADFLSVMESQTEISLHPGTSDWCDIPSKIKWPSNLFIIGTVNIDETTYMFSPKVLDRASVIEFRVTAEEMDSYLKNGKSVDLASLKGKGNDMAKSFLDIANNKEYSPGDKELLKTELIHFFNQLKKTGAEFGFRSASEIIRYAAVVNKIEPTMQIGDIIDSAIMQKLLPKVHGSRKKLKPVLETLGALCLNDKTSDQNTLENLLKNFDEGAAKEKVKYQLSFEKISRMYRNLLDNGFTSYSEA
jgi:5-methylcytosine-specific restriction protein B